MQSDYKIYSQKHKPIVAFRPYVPGEDLSGVVDTSVLWRAPREGDMIARPFDKLLPMRIISAEMFRANYIPIEEAIEKPMQSEFKIYPRKPFEEFRPYIPGEDLSDIRGLSEMRRNPEKGDMIARPFDKLLSPRIMSRENFVKYYDPIPETDTKNTFLGDYDSVVTDIAKHGPWSAFNALSYAAQRIVKQGHPLDMRRFYVNLAELQLSISVIAATLDEDMFQSALADLIASKKAPPTSE